MMEGKSPKDSKRRARPQYLEAEANPSPGATSGISHPGMNGKMSTSLMYAGILQVIESHVVLQSCSLLLIIHFSC